MKTLGIRKTFIALTLSVAAATAANASLIVNGGFEQPTAFGSGQWATYSSIPGWSKGNTFDLEIGYGGVYGITGYSGNVMELDAYGNVLANQIVGATTGTAYTLSFLYAARGNVATASTTFNVLWNNTVIASFVPTSTAMTLYTTTVIGGIAPNTLQFQGTGTQDQLGALIDSVSLVAVPEPSTYLAGALLLLPFGAQVLRRLRPTKPSA